MYRLNEEIEGFKPHKESYVPTKPYFIFLLHTRNRLNYNLQPLHLWKAEYWVLANGMRPKHILTYKMSFTNLHTLSCLPFCGWALMCMVVLGVSAMCRATEWKEPGSLNDFMEQTFYLLFLPTPNTMTQHLPTTYRFLISEKIFNCVKSLDYWDLSYLL